MKYALVNGIRKEASPKTEGLCPCCKSEVRSYCGPEKVNHWKHKALQDCDNWYERETEWHREWKNNFDSEYQEIVKLDPENGEKHIADIYLDYKDLVIEIQHSPIKINEIESRENFYKKMIWIIDLIPYQKNIKLFSDIKSNFGEEVEYAWAKREDAKYRKLKKEGRLKEAEEVRKDNSGWKYIDYFEKKYFPYTAKNDYYLMVWKYQHKRWDEAKTPIFFDMGGDSIYYLIESFKIGNGFIIKRFDKTDFLDHYKKVD
ncbi:competence protein CoiA [Christiangramia sp. OXR-203]|uniref:competence protein CoiA n=1 Tax=Christiangramia sp. OXR-203 TaxID=3100176 RepID=UPI002AC9EF09|nr:competence protein CoiA family protein [Christiangramia sp. OXR-203]WPZ00076.1 hypothetical protein T8I65_07640 [Christiangramia sp. OXR-203]